MLARKGIPIEELPRDFTPHRSRWCPALAPGGKWGQLCIVSVYGYPSEGAGPKNRALVREVRHWLSQRGNVPVLFAGDWNINPEELTRAGADALGVRCGIGRPTCRPSKGASREIDHFILTRAASARAASWREEETGVVPTHSILSMTLSAEVHPRAPGLWAPPGDSAAYHRLCKRAWEARDLP